MLFLHKYNQTYNRYGFGRLCKCNPVVRSGMVTSDSFNRDDRVGAGTTDAAYGGSAMSWNTSELDIISNELAWDTPPGDSSQERVYVQDDTENVAVELKFTLGNDNPTQQGVGVSVRENATGQRLKVSVDYNGMVFSHLQGFPIPSESLYGIIDLSSSPLSTTTQYILRVTMNGTNDFRAAVYTTGEVLVTDWGYKAERTWAYGGNSRVGIFLSGFSNTTVDDFKLWAYDDKPFDDLPDTAPPPPPK